MKVPTIEQRSISYATYVVTATVVFLISFPFIQNLHASDCYQTATVTDVAEARAALGSSDCSEPPFLDVLAVLDHSILETSEATADADEATPSRSGTRARAWLITWSALLAATIAASFGGALMAAFDGWRLSALKHWLIGAAFAALGSGVLYLALNGRQVTLTAYGSLHSDNVTTLSLLAIVPGLVTVATVIAIGHTLAHRKDVLLDQILEARTTTNLLTTALGASLTLGVLATGARWAMIGELPGAEPVPSIIIVMYGATFTAVVAALYIPTQTRINKAVEGWIDGEVRRELGAETPHYQLPALQLRKALREDIGDSDSQLGVFGASLSVLAPIATAAASSILA